MAEPADESQCWVDDCQGARFDRFPECFPHLGATARTEALARLRPGADLDLRGTQLTADDLTQLLNACRNSDGVVALGTSRFDDVVFTDEVDLADVVFTGDANFPRARWDRGADFTAAHFVHGADFLGAIFADVASFNRAECEGYTVFRSAHFLGPAMFSHATFRGQRTSFVRARFDLEAYFNGARFSLDLGISDTWFNSGVSFERSHFEGTEELGPFAAERVLFDQAQFDAHVTLDLRARELSMARARLAQGGVLRLQETTVWLDGAALGGTTAVVGAEVLLSDDTPTAETDRESVLETTAIASIRGVDASQLVLSGVDLTSCRFSAAYQLDRLRIEGRCRFGSPPTGFHPPFPGWPAIWRWTRRRTIIEEHRWRARQPQRPEGWTADYPETPRTFGWRQPTHPERLATIYRQLRKAFEDGKDEPGAADFYYGEMEMRRLSPSTPAAERGILTLYWLFSGYGLRAGRALLGLVGLVALTTGLLAAGGFVDPGANAENALRTALNAVVFRSTAEELTTFGVYVEMVARVLGPVLLALAALSVRNRVKR